MKRKLIITLIIMMLLLNVSFNVIVNAANSQLLISVGTGNYYIEVTKTTTVDDIIKVLGEPKLETPSAFGGNAYAFYTDDNYSNYLYIETTEDGTIASYGSIDPTYRTQTYSYGDDYPYGGGTALYGCLISNDGTVGGGVYYNKSALFNGNSSEIRDFYEKNYLANEEEYLMGLSKQGILMYNARSLQLGNRDTTKLEFNEEFFYINEQFKEYGSSIREYVLDMDLLTSSMKSIGSTSNVKVASSYYMINPILFAGYANNNYYTVFGEKNIPVFDYDVNRGILSAVAVSKDTFNRSTKVEYTEEEKEKLEAGRNEYKQAMEKLQNDDPIYEIEPVTTTASGLVAGKLNSSKQEGILQYINAIRVAAGLPKFENNETANSVAQHKATLLSYRYDKLGLDITHSPEKPSGVSDSFYNTAMGDGIGYAENIGISNKDIRYNEMIGAINRYLDDSSEYPQTFGHRLALLSSKYKYFGFGISPYISSNEFNGFRYDYDDCIEAWPSNGITFMETLSAQKFVWTARFVDKYTVQDTTTATIKCLNTGETWNFTEHEKNNDRWFACSINAISSLNNKLVMYDSSIIPQAGYVYEITLHGLKDDETGKNADYTYRAVFEYADVSNYADTIGSIEIEEPDLEKEGEIYKVRVGQEVKLNAKIDNTEVVDKKITWTSSNEDVIEVKQNGELKIKKESDEPVTIRVSSDANGLSDSIEILVKKDEISINYENYQLNKPNETVQLEVKLNGSQKVNTTWKSSKENVATVDRNGKVTAKAGGFVNITGTTEYGNVNCLIYVSLPITLSDGSKKYAGDLNNSGGFDIIDASMIIDIYKKGNITEDDILIADINGDNSITAQDSSLLQNIYLLRTFEISEYDDYLKGDINQDGIVNAVDVSYGMRGIIHKIELTDSEKEIGDVNGDGIFNVVDVNDIMRYVIGKIKEL